MKSFSNRSRIQSPIWSSFTPRATVETMVVITPASQRSERRVRERVELEADVGLALRQLFAERVIGRAAEAVRRDRNARDLFLRARHVEQLEELRVHRGLAAREVDRLERAFLLDEPVEDLPHLLAGHVVVVPVLDDADRALEVAMVGDLDDRQARVLLVIRAEAAIVGAAAFDLGRVLEGV